MNYFKIALRNLYRNRSYAFINIVGLTLGIGIALVLFWVVRFESSFDRYHKHSDRIYRIRSVSKFGGINSQTPQGVIKALNEQIPGVEKAAAVYRWYAKVVQVGQQTYKQDHAYFVRPEFLEMVDIEWVEGSPAASLSEPYQVVLDETTAQKLFKGDALGKTVRFDNQFDLTVSGIIRKVPANSEFQFQMLFSYETLKKYQESYNNEDHWGGGDSWYQGFVLLKPGADPQRIEATLTAMAEKRKDQTDYVGFDLLPLTESHFDTENDAFNYSTPKWLMTTLAAVSLFLILIACINFVNLATVQAVQRSREIGVRKILGSSRSQLMKQFLGETALLVIFSIVLGAVVAEVLVHYADQLLNTQVSRSDVWNRGTGMFLAALGLFVTLLSGSYPALLISGYQPVQMLNNKLFSSAKNHVPVRQILVITQFVLALVLVICTLVGTRQVRYFYQKDLGFSRDAVVTVDMPERGNKVLQDRFRQALLSQTGIRDITYGLTTPSSERNHWWRTVWHPGLPDGEDNFRTQYVDTNYFRFFQIPLLAGRQFSAADTNASVVIVNEKAIHDMDYRNAKQALGNQIDLGGDYRPNIIGVVKDFHSQTLHSEVVPHVFHHGRWNFQEASIRIAPAQSQKALKSIEQYWKALFPEYHFEYHFLDREIRAFYESERKLSNFLTLFSVAGILIGCLGLYGMISFVCVQRTKEVGIRKVLGASITNIITLLSASFLKLVAIAFLIASPLAWWILNQWLRDYTYHIKIGWWIFALAGGLAIVVALLTVSYQSVKTALMNPVKSLRSE